MTLPFLRSPIGHEPVMIEGEFATSPARMFRAWTDPEELKSWFGSAPGSVQVAEIDLRVGGAWRFEFSEHDDSRDSLFGEYLAVEPDRLLKFSWCHERRHADGRVESSATSEVTVTFEPVAAGVRMKLVHAGIVSEDGRRGVGGGWNASFESLTRIFGGAVDA